MVLRTRRRFSMASNHLNSHVPSNKQFMNKVKVLEWLLIIWTYMFHQTDSFGFKSPNQQQTTQKDQIPKEKTKELKEQTPNRNPNWRPCRLNLKQETGWKNHPRNAPLQPNQCDRTALDRVIGSTFEIATRSVESPATGRARAWEWPIWRAASYNLLSELNRRKRFAHVEE